MNEKLAQFLSTWIGNIKKMQGDAKKWETSNLLAFLDGYTLNVLDKSEKK